MIRAMLGALAAIMMAGPVLAADAPVRAVPGAGWSSVPMPGDGGEQVYRRYCYECHGSGPDKPGTVALQAKYKGAVPALLEQRTNLTAAFVAYTVRHGVSVMPAMRRTEISDAELKAIAGYLSRNTKAQ